MNKKTLYWAAFVLFISLVLLARQKYRYYQCLKVGRETAQLNTDWYVDQLVNSQPENTPKPVTDDLKRSVFEQYYTTYKMVCR